MSSCLGSRACGFDIDQMIKWPRTSTTSSKTISNSSSPSSTLSESSNSPIAISTRKPRAPRKRPNQTYNEAAALLFMACPNIFNTKHLTKRTNNLPTFSKQHCDLFNELPELILPYPAIENSGILLRQRNAEKPCLFVEPKFQSTGELEIESNCVSLELSDEGLDDFDTQSLLDEEIEQGIDSIMGDSNLVLVNDESNDIVSTDANTSHGYPMGMGFGARNGVKALRNGDEGNWWRIPMVDMVDITPAPSVKCEKSPVGKKKKKKKVEELMKSENGDFGSRKQRLLLKLNYDAVLNAWSDRESPVPEEISQPASLGDDVHARGAHIDLFSENGGWRESSATRSTDKNHIKKIRYQLKNLTTDRRPRCKGRFVTKPGSLTCDEET
ncbi:unnamed protein product [Lactuca saligna]|uniref:CCT domain-containing protein n=1 Tax=Lactuca saligna TaxID=75948 RepID=A0AA35ZTL2_LACSI|nr:unnamed protein product [Lactuca saligna]